MNLNNYKIEYLISGVIFFWNRGMNFKKLKVTDI